MARMWRRKGYDISCNCRVGLRRKDPDCEPSAQRPDFSHPRVEALFQYADADADGMLNLLEFCELLHEMRLGLDTDSLIELFMLLCYVTWSHCWGKSVQGDMRTGRNPREKRVTRQTVQLSV